MASPSASQIAFQSGVGSILIQVQGDRNTVNTQGLPYLTLIPWRMEVTEPRRDLDLLKAACQAVPVYGRQADLEFFEEWLQGAGTRIAALVGNSGAGKTRLALKLLQRLPDSWDGGFLTKAEAERFYQRANLSAWGWQRPTVIVVDDPVLFGPVLREWFTEVALHPGAAHPLRILLLERHADVESGWYKDLTSDYAHGDRVQQLLQPGRPRKIEPVTGEADRRAILAAGLEAAHRFYPQRSVPALPAAGEDEAFDRRLADKQWDDPLLLLMAALVAILNGLPQALSLSRTDLAKSLAQREVLRIVEAGADAASGKLLAHLYACVVLCAGMRTDTACQVAEVEFAALYKQYPKGAGQAVDDLRRILGARDTLPSLTPDLLAEAFLLYVFTPLSRQGVGVIARVAPVAIGSAAGVLIRTARDFGPRVGDQEENPVPLLWLEALLKQGELDPSILSAIEAALPDQTVHLSGHAVEVMLALIDQWRKLHPGEGDGDNELARLLNNLSVRQSAMGLRQPALDSSSESVRLYTELARANPDAFLPDLALSLNNLSVRQSEMGQRQPALDSISESVRLYTELARTKPDTVLPDLAGSLNNLSIRQSEMGLRQPALDSGSESVRLYTELARANPDAFLPDLARSLTTLSLSQSEMGLRQPALDSISESVRLRRELARANPDAFLPDLARSLSVLGDRLMVADQLREARDAAAESLRCLAPAFTRYSQSFEGLARVTLNDYLTRTRQLGEEPDPELLAPYASLVDTPNPGEPQ